MSQAKWVERSLYPYVVILQSAPLLGMVPLVGFWFGYGLASRIIVTVLVAIFPVTSATLYGLMSIDKAQQELFTLGQAGRITRLQKLQLPAATPSFLVGLQISAVLSVAGSVVGDFFFKQGDAGIGVLIDLYRAVSA